MTLNRSGIRSRSAARFTAAVALVATLLATLLTACSSERQILLGFRPVETHADGSETIAVWTEWRGDSIDFGRTRIIERNLVVITGGDTVTTRLWYPSGVAVDTGALVILIPGYGESSTSMFPLAAETTRRGLVTAMLVPRGTGFNSALARTYGIAEVDDAIAMIHAYETRHDLQQARVGIFGTSLGGVIGLTVATREATVQAIATEGMMPLLDTAARSVMSVADYTRAVELLTARESSMLEYSPATLLPQLPPMPLLAIWGTGDRLVSIDERARVRQLLAGRTPPAVVVDIPGGIHSMRYGFPLSSDSAVALNARVAGFLHSALSR